MALSRRKGILKRPPRNPLEGSCPAADPAYRAGGNGNRPSVAWNYTTALQRAILWKMPGPWRLTTMVFFQFFQAWNSRSEYDSIFRINPLGNPFLFYSMIAAVLAQLAFIYAPPCSGSSAPCR